MVSRHSVEIHRGSAPGKCIGGGLQESTPIIGLAVIVFYYTEIEQINEKVGAEVCQAQDKLRHV